MASLKYEGNATFQSGTLASSYTSGGGTLSLTSGHGDRFPSAADFWVRVDSEIFRVTARTGDTLTVTGAQDGTAAANHSAGAAVKWVMGASALTQLKLDAAGLILLDSQEASGVAALNFPSVVSSLYDDYIIRILGLIPATDGATLGLQVTTDNGSNYEATNYLCALTALRENAAAASNLASTTHIMLSNGQDTDAAEHWSGRVDMFTPGSAAIHKFFNVHGFGISNADGNGYTFRGGGRWATTTALTGFRIIAVSGGNLTSGIVRVYGWRK